MKILLLPVVVLLLVLPPVFAFECSSALNENRAICFQINNMNLTESEKESLMTLVLYPDRDIPNHEFVEIWNKQISMTTAPDWVITRREGVIRNAWLEIISIMPSVIESGILYCDRSGEIKSAFDYDIILPTGTQSGDCKTRYSLYRDRTYLEVFQNGQKIGSNELVQFSAQSEQIKFETKLNIIIDTKIEHYEEERYCCRYQGNKCNKYCYRCQFEWSEIKTDRLTLTDELFLRVYNSNPEGRVIVTKTNDGKASISNTSRFLLSFQNSSYSQSNYVYDFAYYFPPYNVIGIFAKPIKQVKTDNIFVSDNDNNFSFKVPSTKSCSLTVSNHFTTKTIPCEYNINNVNLSIKTDKFYYKRNSTIVVSIEPKNLPVNVTYGTQSKLGQGNVSFSAEYPVNKVSASYDDEVSDAFINVSNEAHLKLASQIILFIFLNYFVFSLLTHVHPFSKWLIVD